MSRPTRTESLRRKARFLELVADGLEVFEAADCARVDARHALRIIRSPDEFAAVVAAIRAGGGPVVVMVEPGAEEAAA